MPVPNDTARYELLDEWIDRCLESRREGRAAPLLEVDDEELFDLTEIAQAITAATLPALSSEPAAVGIRRLSAGTLARIAAVVLLLAAIGAGVAIARSERAATRTLPTGPSRATDRCLGRLRAVETDGAHLPHMLLVNIETNLRGAGDPCPRLPVLWSSGPSSTAPPTSSAARGDSVAYDVEARGAFFTDPLSHRGLTRRMWFYGGSRTLSLMRGKSGFEPLSRLGRVHELRLVPVTPQPSMPGAFVREISSVLRDHGDASPTVPVEWTAMQLRYAVSIAPEITDGVSAPAADRVVVAQIAAPPAPLGGTEAPLAFAFFEGKGFSLARTGAPLPGVAALLASTQPHTEWLPVRLPSRLPAWVRRDLEEQATANPHARTIHWTVTTAGAIERLNRYQTEVQPGVPPVTPVWVCSIRLTESHQTEIVVISSAHPGATTPKVAITDSGPLFPVLPLSRIGAVHALTTPRDPQPPTAR